LEDVCGDDSGLLRARTHGLHVRGKSILMSVDAQLYQAYYDGSGNNVAAAVSLAGAAHFEMAWSDFDADWAKTLRKHGAECFHMCDAIALQKKFDRRKGWDEKKVNELITDLVAVMSEHRNRGLQFRGCTILCKDYEAAKRQYKTLRPLPAIAVNFCIGGLAVPSGHDLLLCFDKNEEFMKQIYRVWRHLKAKPKGRTGWVAQTRNIFNVNRGYCGIQAADFVAWSLNREHTHRGYEHWTMGAKLLCLPDFKLYDYDAIVEGYANDKWT